MDFAVQGSSGRFLPLPTYISFAMPDPIRGQSATGLCTTIFSIPLPPAVPCVYPAVPLHELGGLLAIDGPGAVPVDAAEAMGVL